VTNPFAKSGYISIFQMRKKSRYDEKCPKTSIGMRYSLLNFPDLIGFYTPMKSTRSIDHRNHGHNDDKFIQVNSRHHSMITIAIRRKEKKQLNNGLSKTEKGEEYNQS
jgi:hypothetical protein